MTRVLVVHHDLDMADQEVASLRRAGYEVDQCAGPTHALRACPVMRGLPCWQVDWADVVVYDEWAAGNGGRELTEDLRTLYPDKPLVLTSLGASLSWVDDESQATTVVAGAPTRENLVKAIEAALGQEPAGVR